MARALWKGAISFGLVTIPVSLYPAKDARDERLVSPAPSGRPAAACTTSAWMRKGTRWPWRTSSRDTSTNATSTWSWTPADLKRANVEATQTIDIMQFVDARGHRHHLLRHPLLHRAGQDGTPALRPAARDHPADRQGGCGQDRHPRAAASLRRRGRRPGSSSRTPCAGPTNCATPPISICPARTWTTWP